MKKEIINPTPTTSNIVTIRVQNTKSSIVHESRDDIGLLENNNWIVLENHKTEIKKKRR